MATGPLSQAVKALYARASKSAAKQLKELSQMLGEHALVEDNTIYVEVAAIAYCLYKIEEKPYLSQSKRWVAEREKVMTRLKACDVLAESGRIQELSQMLGETLSIIDHYSLENGLFKGSLVEKARTKIATDIYAHGASLGRAAELGGVSRRDLMSYIGVTKLSEKYLTLPAEERLANAKSIFVN